MCRGKRFSYQNEEERIPVEKYPFRTVFVIKKWRFQDLYRVSRGIVLLVDGEHIEQRMKGEKKIWPTKEKKIFHVF